MSAFDLDAAIEEVVNVARAKFPFHGDPPAARLERAMRALNRDVALRDRLDRMARGAMRVAGSPDGGSLVVLPAGVRQA